VSLAERIDQAFAIDDGKTHGKHAESRDAMLALMDEMPDDRSPERLRLIRGAAERCSHVGPFEKAIELYRKLAPISNDAGDYFKLSEVLTHGGDHLDESAAALKKATELNSSFDTQANREALRIAQTGQVRRKIGRYPDTKDFHGDFEGLIRNHIAVNLNSADKFISEGTSFFTMGSCFARNIGQALANNGYVSNHMEISEHINTTFANRMFVDWLRGVDVGADNQDRIVGLLPTGWGNADLIYKIATSDVFILTLGVAAAFFDRETGDFVLPRPSALNSRVLAERYRFRTTTVRENVDNVLHMIGFIRNISPDIKIVVTVSPVPMLASFEFESAVQADCLSKSTMRLVAHEVVNNSGLENIIYWPSFEIFRWAGSNASDYFAADDGAAWHVSENKVDGTVKAFVGMFS